MKKPFLLTMCLLTFLLSCGSDNDDNDDAQREEDVNQETEGYYEANLVPLNVGVAGSTGGKFSLRINGDEVRVRGSVRNAPGTFHRQFIHRGANCPGPGADTNRDGTLSFTESLGITGDALVPLDRNLSTQTAGYIFPTGTSYTYSETTSLVRMIADLRADDPDTGDFLGKLDADEEFNPAGRAIVVYGVRGNSELPIACGALVRAVEPLPDEEVRPLPPSRPVPGPGPVPLPPSVPWGDSFSTVMGPDLIISGTKCIGGERTQDNWVCRKYQWMVAAGPANENPFIAQLILVRDVSTNQTAYYNIRPVSPVDNETFNIARDHWVRFSRFGAPLVLRKPDR